MSRKYDLFRFSLSKIIPFGSNFVYEFLFFLYFIDRNYTMFNIMCCIYKLGHKENKV